MVKVLLLFQFIIKHFFLKKGKNVIVINIGGISNFTFLSGKDQLLASDIGPGNTLIDRVSTLKFNKYFDKNGLLASKGEINHNLIKNWMKNNIFQKKNLYPLILKILN